MVGRASTGTNRMSTINSLREDMRRHQAEVDADMLRGPQNPYKPKPMRYSPAMRERDIFFQIRMMDWMIPIYIGVLIVAVGVGIWAVYRMVMG